MCTKITIYPFNNDIVTRMPIGRHRLGKYIPQAHALNNRTAIAR
jgi:hypothetical protein